MSREPDIFAGAGIGYDRTAWDRIFLGWELFADTLPPATVQLIRLTVGEGEGINDGRDHRATAGEDRGALAE